MNTHIPATGRCTCGEVNYRLLMQPMFVHCCHCTWCQRESGSSFAVNALVEAEYFELLKGKPVLIDIPSASGKRQTVLRCATCHIAISSHYSSAREAIHFVRVGTLDEPNAFPPNIHIYTSTKQRWLQLTGDIPIVSEYYGRETYWSQDSRDRYKRLVQRMK